LERDGNRRVHEETEKRHGRLEHRKIETISRLPASADFPGLKQICRITSTRTIKGNSTTEVSFVITSLSRKQAGPKRLLQLTRRHWSIENELHYVRDVTMGEDACRVRKDSAPQIMAASRNLALFLIRNDNRFEFVPDGQREFAARPRKALRRVMGGAMKRRRDY
jgi:predicted transposase YbfD/YdcC